MTTSWTRIIITLAGLLACFSSAVYAQTKSHQMEVFDAKHWDFSNRLSLKSNWTFLENKIVSPEAIGAEDLTSSVFFPALWNDLQPEGKGTGYATYALNILLPHAIDTLAMEIPQLYSSYNMWVNGELVASAGTVGSEKESVKPKWVYQYVSFPIKKDTLQVILQLANFHHHKGGAMNPIYLGTHDQIRSHFQWSIGSNLIEAGILLLEGIFFLFFHKRKQKPVILYFALICITWSVRSIFSNLYPVILIFPDFSWEWLVKIEYITLYLTIIWAALFFNSLFTDISNAIFTYLPVVINLLFIVFTLTMPAMIYTRWVDMYLGVAALVILHGIILIVRALLIERDGSWFLMSSIWIGVLLFGYDIAAYHGSFSYNIVFLNIGYVLIFILTTIALLFHIGVFKGNGGQKDLLTFQDLYQSDKERLGKS